MSEENKQLSFPFEVLEEEMLNPLLGHQLNETEGFVATELLNATREKPMMIRDIIAAAKAQNSGAIGERQVKKIIRSLRRNHAFPILSRKEKPHGYYWATSEGEVKEFIKTWSAQYQDEAATLRVMLRHNFPRLAGQRHLFLDRSKAA
jgi:hypothetical protein